MSEYRGTDQTGKFFAVHDPRLSVWSAETTMDQADPHPGAVTPASTSRARLVARGEQAGSSTYELRCVRGGLTSSAPEVAYRVQGGSSWYGWDAPVNFSWVQPVFWTSSSTVFETYPNLCALGNDDVLAVFAEDAGSPRVTCSLRSASAGTWSAVSVILDVGVSTYIGSPQTKAYPLRMRDEEQTVLLYVLRHYTSQGKRHTQLDVYSATEGDDLSDGSSFTIAARNILPAAIEHAIGDEFHIMAARGSGAVVLVIQQDAKYHQYYSIDGGYNMAEVSTVTLDDAAADLVCSRGQWVLAYATSAREFRVRRIGSPADSFADADAVLVAEITTSGPPGPFRLAVDDVEGIWAYVWDGFDLQCWHSQGSGADGTWQGVLTGAVSSGARCNASTHVSTTSAQGLGLEWDCVWWRGRVLAVGRAVNAIGYGRSVIEWRWGRFSSHTLVRRDDRRDPVTTVSWDHAWLCTERPDGVVWTGSSTGSGAARAWQSDASLQLSTGASDTQTYTANATLAVAVGDAVGGIGGACRVTAGKLVYLVAIGDTRQCIATLEQTSTTLAMLDGVSGSTIASATIDAAYYIETRIEVKGQQAFAMYRTWADDHASTWTVLGTTSALTVAAAAVGYTQWHLQASTTVRAFYVGGIAFGATEHSYMGESMAEGYTVPERLRGIPLATDAQYMADGVYLAGFDGPFVAGEQWTLAPASSFAVELAASSNAYPNTSSKHVSETTTDGHIIAYQLDGGLTCSTIGKAWAVWLESDAYECALSWHDGTSWGSDITLARSYTFTGVREGSTVRPSAVATSSAVFVEEGETVGGYISFGSGKTRTITAQRAGKLKASTSSVWRPVEYTIEGIDGTEPTSGSFTVVWPRSVHVLTGADVPATAKGVRLKFFSSTAFAQPPPSGRWHTKLLMGPIVPIPEEHGLDSVRISRPVVDEVRTEAGYLRARKMAAPRRLLELHWEDAPVSQWPINQAGQHDYLAAVNGGSPTAMACETLSTVRSWVETWGSERTPVLYGWYYREYPLDTQHLLENHQKGAFLGVIESEEWRTQHTGNGQEQVDEIVRGGTVRLSRLD